VGEKRGRYCAQTIQADAIERRLCRGDISHNGTLPSAVPPLLKIPHILLALSLLAIQGFALSACNNGSSPQSSPKNVMPTVDPNPPTVQPLVTSPKPQCDSAPYGDTPENYATAVKSDKDLAAKYGETVAKMTQYITQQALIEACKVKFENADRQDFHNHGITDANIAVTSTVGLASEYMTFANVRGDRELQQHDYRAISVRNFLIDGPRLAAAHAKVKLVGSYVLQGSVGMLYIDSQAVAMARYGPQSGAQLHVALMANDGSHRLREYLLSCSSSPGTGLVVDCPVEIRGQATICTLSNAFGATQEVPCVDAEDGGRWSPPPPTPEQVRETQYLQCVLNVKRNYPATQVANLITPICGSPP